MSSTPRDQPRGDTDDQRRQGIAPPAISLPKGGGAVQGMGEKFTTNAVNGTASMTIPIATSPGRSGFGPQLALAYDSGSGNGPFGFGWSLSVPNITRKTARGLPEYRDRDESDIYLLTGVEDLVPVLDAGGMRWHQQCTLEGIDYCIQRYRPRIEGLFARIERWMNATTGEIHWRSISRENVTTVYGKTGESRIADPADPRRVFSWLMCESYDDRGNAMLYEYVPENDDNVDRHQANERNRRRTANRYLKRILYGNTESRLVQPDLHRMHWLFEVVFDYDEGHYREVPLDPKLPPAEQHQRVRASLAPDQPWTTRPDPFSEYRPGFEVRTYRRCHRVLMFHHFAELGDEPCLVRSTSFDYADLDYSRPPAIETELAHQGSTRFASFIRSVTQSGYVRTSDGTYIRKSLPPLELEYSKASIHEEIREVEAENLPVGLDGLRYRWVDLDGEGISGILTEQGDTWFYKPNLGNARFGPLQVVPEQPSLAALGGGRQQLVDLAGDGTLDLVQFEAPTPGFYERTEDASWEPFKAFRSLPVIDWSDPNLRLIDLNGDGHADVLITEQQVLTWYPSLAEEGFGSARRVYHQLDEERGPRLVFADGTQSIYLADMCGHGLTDLARIRNGEVCYWPNLGHGRFGAKVTMDNAPWFDEPDQFNQQRVRLTDIDGSGTSDIIYLGRDGARLYFNESGNRWSQPRRLRAFPPVDNLSTVTTVDLLGNGTTCLVWSSPLPGDARRPLRYIDLMGGQKPHLLVKTANNLGAETHITYASSTKFYLADREAGKSWITRLPFPVHVVERSETHDRISRNRFVTRFAYHHGYFDGIEREFRGFGMVEQWDTESFAALSASSDFPDADNIDAASHVPPVLTRTWFHTGVYRGREHVSDYFAGLVDEYDQGEFYREPWLTDAQARELLLDDTILPEGLSVADEREACRALKGSMLRQEVYALDGSEREAHPYTVTEQNFAIKVLQPRGPNRNLVFFTHARESLSFHYERNPNDPRVTHALTLEVDRFGNVLQQAAVGYGRRQTLLDLNRYGDLTEIPNPGLRELDPQDQATQTRMHITYTRNTVTNPVDADDSYRTPLPSGSQTYELAGINPPPPRGRLNLETVLAAANQAEEIPYEQTPDASRLQQRLIEHVRTVYRRDDLDGPLPHGSLESLALPFESYQMAFTPGLITQVYGDRMTDAMLESEGRYVHLDGDENWWIPSGRMFFSPGRADTPAQERDYAHHHFFLPHRYRNPFHTDTVSTESCVTYDHYDLLLLETRDPLGNRVTVGERDVVGNVVTHGNDYRVLQPAVMMDPNRNRSNVAFDALGMVAGTAVMGKPKENEGDTLEDFVAHLTEAQIRDQLANPLDDPHAILRGATSRQVYDLFAYSRTRNESQPQPSVVYTLARETHVSDLAPGDETKIRHSFAYSDGFGREIQHKIEAEPGPVPQRDATGTIILDSTGQPVMADATTSPRWVGSGWMVFNNKEKVVRQYEAFFTDTHTFEFEARIGVSAILFYDPIERVVATLHPNHTWEKVIVDPWREESWDVNDTVLLDPQQDANLRGFLLHRDGTPRLPPDEYLPTWYALRAGSEYAEEARFQWPDRYTLEAEQDAARKAAVHAASPLVSHADALGRTILTVAHNRYVDDEAEVDTFSPTRVVFDFEGNEREVIDALGRVVIRYEYDMLGNPVRQSSMEAGERWILTEVAGNPIYGWDSRGHRLRTTHDQLRRPDASYLQTGDGAELLVGRSVYGEQYPEPEARNLRLKMAQTFDQAGVVTTDAYDFKGNLLVSRRQLAAEYKATLNWVQTVPLEDDVYSSRTTFDALNRAVTITAPDSSTVRPTYNDANLLERLEVNLRGEETDGRPIWTPFVSNINYDAKGQRELIEFANGATTRYTYDLLTSELIRLQTTRAGQAADGSASTRLQDLRYAYDPVGNITSIRDNAQQTIYFRNKRVDPHNSYTYDALYRLLEATGREHLGQAGSPPAPPSPFNGPRVRIDHPGDGNAMGRYREHYAYDATGNILEVRHHGDDPAAPGWSRTYTYAEASLIEPEKLSNRLSHTRTGNGELELYAHDEHGNITRMPHLSQLRWDYRDQLQATARQVVNSGTPETTWYVYDASGQRVRKVTERQAADDSTPTRRNERTYLAGFEIYREYSRHNEQPALERETLHVIEGKWRVALVETRTAGDDGSPAQQIRYQFSNHLGSATLELDNRAWIISYEEYTPYGNTSYQAVRSQTDVPKRYRYSGKERDEESGFYYHGRRYYAPWLARWTSADPAGIRDGPNLYQYVQSNPLTFTDSTGTISEEKLAENKFEEFLKQQKVNYKKQVPIRVKVNGEWVAGQTDFLVERPGGKWEPVEFKGRDTSSWTPNQQKYLPALQKGAEFEVTGRFKRGYKGTGGGTVITLKTVEDAVQQFKKIFTTEYINRTKGYKVRTSTDWEGNIVNQEKTPIQPKKPTINQKVGELAKAKNMRIKNQGGFARIGVMGFIAIATSAGIIIASEDRLDAVIELAKSSAADMALGALFFKLTRSAGIAGILTMVVGMESDSAAHNEAMAKNRMINDYIFNNFPDVVSKYRYCDALFGVLCTGWTYEAKDYEQYQEIYNKIEYLVDNPYTLEGGKTEAESSYDSWLRHIEGED